MKRSIVSVPVRRAGSLKSGQTTRDQDLLAVEEPLQIRLGDRDLAITMRTPGNDEELSVGFLFTEGILPGRDAIASATPGDNSITIALSGEASVDLSAQTRHFYLTSSCGVCGKASVNALVAAGCTAPPADRPMIDAAVILKLPETLRATQPVFDRTGGLHAAALFDAEGKLQLVREDVGRHNAVDKLVGRSVLDGRVPLNDSVLLVSGRASFELVQKALMAGISVLAAVGAPSSLAVETAMRFGMTLAGFVRDGRFNIYSGEGRIHHSK
ncbi:MAG: formate dehydrogenase [Bryobacterales bacterium]|nr:formate dehydrogenase [Bryobacterales bacterium]